MKKRIMAILVALTAAVLCFTGAAGASDIQQQIYDFCVQELGMNSAAACGVLANIQKESSFNPKASHMESDGMISYGLCQWHASRYNALLSYCSSNGYDYTTATGQLYYLKYELEHSESYAYGKIKNVDNTAEGAYTAGYNWARYFERCSQNYNGVDQYDLRAVLARDTYWPSYGSSTLSSASVTTDRTTYTLGNTVTVQPSSTGGAYYTMRISLETEDNTVYEVSNGFTGTKTYTPTQTGHYIVRISAYGSSGSWLDAVCTFEVEEPVCNNFGCKYYTDVVGTAWYHIYTDYANEKGLMQGTDLTARTFEPEAELTRAQLAQILYNLEGKPAVTATAAFTDVGQDWYTDAVSWAAEKGIVNGYYDEAAQSYSFHPDQPVTRQEMVTMLYRYAGTFKGLDVSVTGDSWSSYSDAGQVEGYAKSAIAWAVESELVNGTSTTEKILEPEGSATRAQIAKIMSILVQHYGLK